MRTRTLCPVGLRCLCLCLCLGRGPGGEQTDLVEHDVRSLDPRRMVGIEVEFTVSVLLEEPVEGCLELREPLQLRDPGLTMVGLQRSEQIGIGGDKPRVLAARR